MENASKALLMAGGVLIAIIIIAVLVRTGNTIANFQKSQFTEEEQEQLVAFNEQYTKYLGEYVYGTDVITVLNKASNNTDYKITVSVKDAENNDMTFVDSDGDVKSDCKTKAFKCTNIEYDSYGRVNSITFMEKKWED